MTSKTSVFLVYRTFLTPIINIDNIYYPIILSLYQVFYYVLLRAYKMSGSVANLRIFEIEEINSVPYTPTSHPFIERLIGTIRREHLDQLFFWNKSVLEKRLLQFKRYYKESRAHCALNARTPTEKAEGLSKDIIPVGSYDWNHHASGRLQLPIAA